MSKKVILQVLIVAGVLFLSLVVFKVMASMRKEPAKAERKAIAPLLNAETVKSESIQISIVSFGTVEPKIEVDVTPQVSGKVVSLQDDFVNGGFFKANEALLTIEQINYELAVEKAHATVKQAEVIYEKELAEQQVAFQEWEQIHPGEKPTSALVTRELQVKHAEAELKAAKANLKNAQLDLERTVLRVPFDGRVLRESVDVGQYLNAAQPVAKVYATATVEIIVPLKDSQLAWFDVPLGYENGLQLQETKGSPVEVVSEFGGSEFKWTGHIVRSEGQIDPSSRMVNIVVEVDNPFRMKNHNPPLVPGMFVETRIKGKNIDDIFRVPRYAVRDGNKLWLEKDGALEIREVEIVRQDKQFAYISDGLKDGEILITSPLDVVTDGMKVRTFLKEEQKKDQPAEAEIK